VPAQRYTEKQLKTAGAPRGTVAIAAEFFYLRVCNTNPETRVSVSGAPDSFFNEKSITK